MTPDSFYRFPAVDDRFCKEREASQKPIDVKYLPIFFLMGRERREIFSNRKGKRETVLLISSFSNFSLVLLKDFNSFLNYSIVS